MRSIGVAAAFVMCAGACGGKQEVTLVASYELGPKELGRAVLLRFPDVLTPTDTEWPAGAEPVSVDVSADRSAAVDLSSETWLAGKYVRIRPARLRFEDGPQAFERYELWAAPTEVSAIDDTAVLLGTSAASEPGVDAELRFTEDGTRWLAYAVACGLPGQAGAQKFSLFLRGRTRFVAAAGDTLPAAPADGGTATRVVVEVDLRASP